MYMSVNINNQRRTFRGRGRQQQRPHTKRTPHNKTKHKHNNDENNRCENVDKEVIPHASPSSSCEELSNVNKQPEELKNLISNGNVNDINLEKNNNNQNHSITKNECFYKEIQMIQNKIKNIQKSIQHSSSSLCDINNYQMNCLNAISKTIHTWKSLLCYYDKDITLECNNGSNNVIKETSLLLFQLIQLSLQCGPLVGSKPGYFKRCGSEVANKVVVYLNDFEPLEEFHFTEKQINVVRKWLVDAKKVAELNMLHCDKYLNKKKKKK